MRCMDDGIHAEFLSNKRQKDRKTMKCVSAYKKGTSITDKNAGKRCKTQDIHELVRRSQHSGC